MNVDHMRKRAQAAQTPARNERAWDAAERSAAELQRHFAELLPQARAAARFFGVFTAQTAEHLAHAGREIERQLGAHFARFGGPSERPMAHDM